MTLPQYILDLARAAQLSPRQNETLVQFARRAKVHGAYAWASADDDSLTEEEQLFHAARGACCDAIAATTPEPAPC